ncbi:MAG: DUF881 domain-containing protein [Nocardioidaceae bacterium]|nr:DUF881 domain-containing protein [Nocardioidaceae bacterium]
MEGHLHKAAAAPSRRRRAQDWARRRWRNRRSVGWRVNTLVAAGCAGLLATTSMINARGTDLRSDRDTDLIGLVGQQRERVEEMQSSLRQLQSDVEKLGTQVGGAKVDDVNERLRQLEVPAGFSPLSGTGLIVTLDDAPRDSELPEGINPNLFIVHQQDIQAVVNALWAGGADGISLQDQRIISTTGIKCVGNTVVLQGVPYAPPYRIRAVGDPEIMYDALSASPGVLSYRQYEAEPYNIGWSLRRSADLDLPAYSSSLDFSYVQPEERP